jgi:hypothetical protein
MKTEWVVLLELFTCVPLTTLMVRSTQHKQFTHKHTHTHTTHTLRVRLLLARKVFKLQSDMYVYMYLVIFYIHNLSRHNIRVCKMVR